MTTAYTSLLGLALPVTGELSGTWGDVVNQQITGLLDSAVAGTTTLSTDGDVTLTTTDGASNQARQAILLCSGARTAARNITAPAHSKIYTVINATTGGYSVVIRGAGPTTGVTVPSGQSIQVAWNGSDFVDVSNSFAATGTANGVVYLNASKVPTTGSNLIFTGTKLGVAGAEATSEVSVRGNVGLLNGGLLQDLYYDGANFKYSYNGLAIPFVLSSDTNGLYIETSTASGTVGTNATTTLQFRFAQNGLLQVVNSPAWVAGGFSGLLGKQLCMGYDVTNSIGYLRSTNNGTSGTALYLDSSELRINIGTSTQSELVRFKSGNLMQFNGSSNITTASTGYLNIAPVGNLILDAGTAGGTTVFRINNADVGAFASGNFIVGASSSVSTSKITSYGNISTGLGGGLLNGLYYDGAWKFVEAGANYAAGNYIDGAGQWRFFATTTASTGAGGAATVSEIFDIGYNKTCTLQGATQTAGTGIAFPAARYGSSNVNTLDDYEEGVFTPYYTTDGSAPTITYAQQSGIYTKVGNLVTLTVRLTTASASGGSGALFISGLPFPAIALPSNNLYNGALGFVFNFNANPVAAFIVSGESKFALYKSTAGNTNSTASDLTNSCYISITVCYQTDN